MAQYTPRILVAALTKADADAAVAELRHCGATALAAWGPPGVIDLSQYPQIDLIATPTGHAPDEAAAIARNIKAQSPSRATPVLALAGKDHVEFCAMNKAFDAVAQTPASPARLEPVLVSLSRLTVMQDELEDRAGSLHMFGGKLRPGEPARASKQHLYVGAAGPLFLQVQAALRAQGRDIVGAPNSFTAFDFIQASQFGSVLVDAEQDREIALALCKGVRRNAETFHLPVILIMNEPQEAEIDAAIAAGADDVVAADGGAPLAAARAIALARIQDRRARLSDLFAAAAMDGVREHRSGLYERGFFAFHLDRMIARAKSAQRPLALAAFQIHHADADAMDRAGAMIGRLIRAEDFAGRLDDDIYVAAMPSAGREGALAASHRIASVLRAAVLTQHEGFEDTIQVRAGAVAWDKGMTAGRLLGAALEGVAPPNAARREA